MSYVIDQVTDRAHAPAFLRAVEIMENINTIEGSLRKFTGAQRVMLEEQVRAGWNKIDDMLVKMGISGDEAWIETAYISECAEERADQRQLLELEKIERREQAAEQRAEQERERLYEEQLINSGIMA